MSQNYMPPVQPSGMEMVFFYECPHCHNQVALLSPIQPALARCDMCRKTFPIVPVDPHTVQYIHLMLDNGKAAADGDFL